MVCPERVKPFYASKQVYIKGGTNNKKLKQLKVSVSDKDECVIRTFSINSYIDPLSDNSFQTCKFLSITFDFKQDKDTKGCIDKNVNIQI